MSYTFCKVCLHGNVSQMPKKSVTSTGQAASFFSIAYESGYKDNKKVIYQDVAVFGSAADMCNTYVRKGAELIVFGDLTQDNYRDNEGRPVQKKKVIASSIHFCGAKTVGLTPEPSMNPAPYGGYEQSQTSQQQPQVPPAHAEPPAFSFTPPTQGETPPDSENAPY